MAAQFDLVVRNGTVIDGTGGEPREADIAVQDGRIAAIGRIAGTGRQEIDAKGLVVTPGFVDIHTHYDGQVTWDDRFAPSSGHGVTTVVMGNCGVGFAPCRPQDRDTLVKVMEGVEDIPELVMREGVPWNWQSFPEYLDALAKRHCDIDFATQVPHAPLRVFVMGRRGVEREPATATDMATMASLVAEGIEAGALGFSTSRSLFHRTPDGALTPTITAAEEELAAIARGMGRIGKGVIQLLDDFQDTTAEGATEFAMLRRLVTQSGRPLSFTLLDISIYPGRWQTLLREVERANRDGLPIRGQVAARPVAILYGLELSFHPFSTCPSYRAVADLPLPQKLARLRDPGLRARLLAEEPVYSNPNMLAFMRNVANMFVLGDPPDYTPPAGQRLDARAAALGVSPLELAYDLLVGGDGRTILFHPGANYTDCSDANMASMLRHENTVMALGDGGAHYGLICDASYPTHALTYWTRDRAGERWPLAWTVQQLTDVPARALGLGDRGRLVEGCKADLNVIDLDRLRIAAPHPVHNPAGRRSSPRAEGGRLSGHRRGWRNHLSRRYLHRRVAGPAGARGTGSRCMKVEVAALLAAGLVLAGCVGGASQGSVCRTTEDTLASLRDGMTYQQVTQVVGCSGTIDRNQTVDGNQVMVARWSGPGQSAFSATLVTFRNDRMIAFGVNGQ